MSGAVPSPDPDIKSLALVRDPASKVRITPTLFAQLPERDFMDHEIGRLIANHVAVGRVVWHGRVWIVFADTTDPVPTLYRYELNDQTRPAFIWTADNECQRLLRVIEAVRVRDGRLDELPVKLTIAGSRFTTVLYTHPCTAVRYPYLMDKAQAEQDIQRWLNSQQFAPDITEPEVVEIMSSIITSCNNRLAAWDVLRQRLATESQVFLSPDADEEAVEALIAALRKRKAGHP
jgi:hypothetical protein